MNYPSQEPPSRVKLLARKAKRALRQKNLDALENSLRPLNARSDQERIHVLGPYRNRDKWRVILVDGKERKSVCVPSQEEALALIAKCRQETERTLSQTIETSLQNYRIYLLGARHVLPSTAEHVLTSLAGWLPVSALVSSLTPTKAQRLYEELTQRISERTGKVLAVATHQFFLSCAKGWGKWALRERLVGANPFADVTVLGKKHNGKMQLRIDEARQLADSTQELADAGDSDALAILLMLHLGLRQGEVGARVARDVDAQGRLLWITAGRQKMPRAGSKSPSVYARRCSLWPATSSLASCCLPTVLRSRAVNTSGGRCGCSADALPCRWSVRTRCAASMQR